LAHMLSIVLNVASRVAGLQLQYFFECLVIQSRILIECHSKCGFDRYKKQHEIRAFYLV
jgi:hypothetical protein